MTMRYSLLLITLAQVIALKINRFFSSAKVPSLHDDHSLACTVDETCRKDQAFVPMIVTKRDEIADQYINEIGKNLNYDIYYANSKDIHQRKFSTRQIVVIDEIDVREGKLQKDTIRNNNAIYFMRENNYDTLTDSEVRDICKYDLFIPEANRHERETATRSCGNRLKNLLQRIIDGNPSSEETTIDAGQWSHFLSLTYPSIDVAASVISELRIGVDAFELRVDLLSDISTISLHRQIALLRDLCPLPIVFTVRSVGQIGKFPPDSKKIFSLLHEGLRAGAEWIDVEACWPAQETDSFTDIAMNEYGATSRLLGSLHVTVPQTSEEIKELFHKSELAGKAHVLKVVTGAASDEDCLEIHSVGASMGKPYIGVCLGADGARSRVLNRRFTPVTHPLMATAAPGQLSVSELMSRRLQEGLISPRNFYLFGTPIQQSLSPSMHNGAYQTLLLPHQYFLNEQIDVTTYGPLLDEVSFGGASVTIPHKETIIPMLDEVRGAALVIGAVNTVVIEIDDSGKRRKIGYNTDWLGMKRPIVRLLQSKGIMISNTNNKHVDTSSLDASSRVPQMSPGSDSSDTTWGVGLVVGAGGTARAACYLINELGLKLVVTNRSPEKGIELAKEFGGDFVSMDSLATKFAAPNSLQVVISTLPAAAGFTLPGAIFATADDHSWTPTSVNDAPGDSKAHRPIVLDVVYKPALTPLLQQAQSEGCLIIQGATMLLEQAMEQFELWNQRRAPRDVMEKAVFSGVEKIA